MAKNPKKNAPKAKKDAAKMMEDISLPEEDISLPEKDTAEAQSSGNDQVQQMVIHSQYIKDFSFENPEAPQVMMEKGGQPEIQINVNVTAKPLNEERLFETVLSIRATAKRDDKNIFIVELDYAGIMSVAKNVEEKVLHPIIMIEGPRLLFPFARAILSEITQSGGFMPLNIQPIDFVQVYQQGVKSQQQKNT
jgi:preprotein translocase subunit SecB